MPRARNSKKPAPDLGHTYEVKLPGHRSTLPPGTERARAFGMNVIAWSPTLTSDLPHTPGVRFCNWPRELARDGSTVAIGRAGDHADTSDHVQFFVHSIGTPNFSR